MKQSKTYKKQSKTLSRTSFANSNMKGSTLSLVIKVFEVRIEGVGELLSRCRSWKQCYFASMTRNLEVYCP